MSVTLTSTSSNQGIAELRQALLAISAEQRRRSTGGLAWLPIDRAFTIPGHGPVVTGTLRGAPVAAGDSLELLPLGRTVRVRAVQVRGEAVPEAQPGQRAAINLRGAGIGELHRGMALAAPGALEPSEWLTLSIRAVAGAPVLKNGARLRAMFGTQEAEARLRLLESDVLEPGEACFAQLRFAAPVALPAGEHVILRRASPAVTVAGGKVLEPVTRRLRRHDGVLLHRLEQLRDLPPAELIAAEVARAGADGTTLRHLSRLTSLSLVRIAELLGDLPVEVTRAGSVMPKGERERRKTLAPRPDPERERADAELAARLPGHCAWRDCPRRCPSRSLPMPLRTARSSACCATGC